MTSRKKRTTLADVAKEAGVSVQTASHVLAENMSVRLPQSTRDKVAKAAEKVGYRPNRLAQAMKAGKTDLIGVWIPLDRPVVNYLVALQQINQHAVKSGYDLMITGLEAKMAYSGEGKPLFNWPVDGLIGYDAGKAIAHFRSDPRNDNVPVVVIGLETYTNSDAVAWTLYDSYKSVVQRLIAKGKKNIVHVTPQWVFREYPREQRRRGYVEAMIEAGLEPKILCACDEQSESGKLAAQELIEGKNIPDAVVCFTDSLAIGVMAGLLDSGVEVPGQCDIWGCGDAPEGVTFRIPLSTIKVPISEAIDEAWKLLMSRIKDPSLEPRLTMLDMHVIERESAKF